MKPYIDIDGNEFTLMRHDAKAGDYVYDKTDSACIGCAFKCGGSNCQSANRFSSCSPKDNNGNNVLAGHHVYKLTKHWMDA